MIFNPSITDILDDDIKARNDISCEMRSIFKNFIDGDLYPTFALLKSAQKNVKEILAKRIQSKLILNSKLILKPEELVQHAVKAAELHRLYPEPELVQIRNGDDFDLVLNFTQWLGDQYEELLALQLTEKANQVWYDLNISYRGPYIQTAHGVLLISYQNEYRQRKVASYSYKRYAKRRSDGVKAFGLSLLPDVTLNHSGVQQCGEDPMRPSGHTTLSYVKSRVPAPFSIVTLPTIRFLFLRELVGISAINRK